MVCRAYPGRTNIGTPVALGPRPGVEHCGDRPRQSLCESTGHALPHAPADPMVKRGFGVHTTLLESIPIHTDLPRGHSMKTSATLAFAITILCVLNSTQAQTTFSPSDAIPLESPRLIPVNTLFDDEAATLRQTIFFEFKARGARALRYVDARMAEAQAPRLLTQRQFNAHLCIRRNINRGNPVVADPLNTRQGFSFVSCTDSAGNLLTVGSRLGDRDLLDHFYTTQVANRSVEVDYLSWQRFRLLSFVLFHLRNDRRVFAAGQDPVFDKGVTLDFFEAAFRRISGGVPLGRTRFLRAKTVELVNPIDYRTIQGVSFGIQFIFGPDDLPPLPPIISEVTCFGRCVTYDESSFVGRIGTFSYAWQILFNGDVNPNFLSASLLDGGYVNLSGGGPTQWLRWVEFIAGDGDEDTLRNTLFFRENFRNVVVRDAVN